VAYKALVIGKVIGDWGHGSARRGTAKYPSTSSVRIAPDVLISARLSFSLSRRQVGSPWVCLPQMIWSVLSWRCQQQEASPRRICEGYRPVAWAP